MKSPRENRPSGTSRQGQDEGNGCWSMIRWSDIRRVNGARLKMEVPLPIMHHVPHPFMFPAITCPPCSRNHVLGSFPFLPYDHSDLLVGKAEHSEHRVIIVIMLKTLHDWPQKNASFLRHFQRTSSHAIERPRPSRPRCAQLWIDNSLVIARAFFLSLLSA